MKKRIDPITKIAIAMRKNRTGFFSSYLFHYWGNNLSRIGVEDDLKLYGLDGGLITKREKKPKYYEK
ncbi:MAG: hypothetical protein ACFFFH_10630 [Candidatus Thorarchaeota archaeon]